MCLPKTADAAFCKSRLNETLGRRELANSSYLLAVRQVLGKEDPEEGLASSKNAIALATWWTQAQMVICGFLGALVALAAVRLGKFLTRYCTLDRCNFRTRRGFQSFSDDGGDSATTEISTGIENHGARLQEVELEQQPARERASGEKPEAKEEEAVEATEEGLVQT